MSLKKKSKSKEVPLRKFLRFVIRKKINYKSLTFKSLSNESKIYLVVGLLKIKLEVKRVDKKYVSNVFYNSPTSFDKQNLIDFLNTTELQTDSNYKLMLKEFSEIVEQLFIFYFNSSVLENTSNLKFLRLNKFDKNEHDRFILVNKSLGVILSIIKRWFPITFNEIFKKIIALA